MPILYAELLSVINILVNILKLSTRLKRVVSAHAYIATCVAGAIGLMLISVVALYIDAGLNFYTSLPVFNDLKLNEGTNTSTPGIGFALQIDSVDVSNNSFSVTWWPVGCRQSDSVAPPQWISDPDTSQAATCLVAMECDQTPASYDVWVDLNPFWSWNATSNVVRRPNTRGRVLLTGVDTFQTSHQFSVTSPVENKSQRRQFSLSAWYPFDVYSGTVVIETFESATNQALSIDFTHLYGGATGFSVTLEVEPVITVRTSSAVMLTFSVRRGLSVQLFAISLAVTNYLLAIGMICIAIAAGMGHRLPDSVLILPLANILALPQLRAAMPDIPDFGVFVDIFCYEVNLLAVVFSAMFIMTRITREYWVVSTPTSKVHE